MSIFDERDRVRPGRVVAWAVLLIILLLAAVWGYREYSASTSGAQGTLAVQQQRGSKDNRTHWSTFFTQKYQDIRADQSNIKIDARVAAAKNATRQDAITLSGTQQVCDQDVSDWNAALDNVLAVVPAGYPQDKLNPDTVCSTDPDTTGFINP